MYIRTSILAKFKKRIQGRSTQQLENMLSQYQIQLAELLSKNNTKQHVEKYDLYLSVDCEIRTSHNKLLDMLECANRKAKHLNDINPELFELYHAGECNYYLNGSIEEIAIAEEHAKAVSNQVKNLEAQYPNLKHKNCGMITEIYYYNLLKHKILIIKRELMN